MSSARRTDKGETVREEAERLTFGDSILSEAEKAVLGARQEAYDHPLDNFRRIAGLWSVILGIPVTEEQHVLCMLAVKIARLMNTPDHRDSIVDLAGYAATLELLQTERVRRSEADLPLGAGRRDSQSSA